MYNRGLDSQLNRQIERNSVIRGSSFYNDDEVVFLPAWRHISDKRSNLSDGTSLDHMEFIDNGVGIEDSRKKIVFQRGYGDEKSIHGMGLGLSLVQKIIDNYNGKIWVEDRVNGDYTKGSNFVILIPEVL